MLNPTTTVPSFGQQVADQRDYLLKFSRLQLRNETWAEDAVSETILAALLKPQSFGHRSQLKTWLVGILKHKVVDCMRHLGRGIWQHDPCDARSEDSMACSDFMAGGHFREPPSDWGNPEQRTSSRQFFEALEICVNKLPPVQKRLFLMREWLELSTEEICKEEQITPTNLYVHLHRARINLRAGLELNGYGQPRPFNRQRQPARPLKVVAYWPAT